MPSPVDASGDEGESRWEGDREIRVLVGVPYAAIKVARSLGCPHLRSNHVLGFPRSGLILLSNCLLKAILEHHMRGNEVGEQVFSLGDFGPSAFSFSTNRCWRPTIRMLLARMS